MDRQGRRAAIAGFLQRAWNDPGRRDIGLYAASGAYHLFLSLGPLTALLLAALPYTTVTEEQLLRSVLAWTPAGFRRLVGAVVADVYAGGAAALGFAAVLELWSGGRFLACVVRASAALRGGRQGFLRTRIMGAVYTAVLILFLLGNVMLLLRGGQVLGAATLRWPSLAGLWTVLAKLRPVLLMGGLTAGNILLFCGGSEAERCLRQVPGAAFAAGGWLVFSRLYSRALEQFGLFGVYGSIAAAAVSLYWIYGSLYILFLGAWINTLRERGEGGTLYFK